jgi:hypothetical protein
MLAGWTRQPPPEVLAAIERGDITVTRGKDGFDYLRGSVRIGHTTIVYG